MLVSSLIKQSPRLLLLKLGITKSIYVCQPWTSHGEYAFQTEPELQLSECVSLASTIPEWEVVAKSILFTNSRNRADLVGKKSLHELKSRILDSGKVSAVFFGVEVLSGMQTITLEKELGLPVFDRFSVVLNIFRHHAQTKEAKLQVASAEIHYIRSHLRQIHESAMNTSSDKPWQSLVGGSGDSYYHKKLSNLKQREARINHLLSDLRGQRDIQTKLRKKNKVPIISVVGYTNSGKTSLIKALTEDERLMPKDQLFATLDVTSHSGSLPSNNTVLYLDTVGFISRVPTLLIEAFETTLAEVKECDLLVHVQDVNHPDIKLQRSTVMKALASMSMPKEIIRSMLTVGSKADLAVDSNDDLPKCDLLVSTKTGQNMNELMKLIDERLCQNLDKEAIRVRVLTGGDNYVWLRANCKMRDQSVDEEDHNYTICKIKMSKTELGRYKKIFGKETIISS